jgi:mevalonate kinase
MEFFASSPCKAILFGEHYVVYGSPALAIPIEPRGRVKFSGSQEPGIALVSSLGNARIAPDFSFSGEPRLSAYSAVAREICAKLPAPSCTAEFLPSWSLKGVGTSSSLGAAFAAGLLSLRSKRLPARKIFLSAQAGDLVAHEGKASGIDARTVAYGKPIVFQRKFAPPKFLARSAKFSLPAGCCLLLIDTCKGKKDSTAAMLAAFASSFGISTLPAATPEEKRKEVQCEFAPILKSALAAKTAQELGKAMDDNHILLRMRRVSSPGLDKAVLAARSAGAYGAKLTGGGGEGGAALALCDASKAQQIASSITEATGFACHPLKLASLGAKIDASN